MNATLETKIRAATHPAFTHWKGCESVIEADALGRRTCLWRFASLSKPPEQAAIWDAATVSLLKSHANIVEVIETQRNTRDARPTIRMRHEPGALSLYDYLTKQRSEISFEKKCAVLRDVLTGLMYLHAAGLVHRELDPRAILIFEDGPVHAKLTNLASIAKIPQSTHASAPFNSPLPGPYAGSERSVDPSNDLRALGFVAHQLLTWTFPPYSDPENDGANVSAVLGALEGGPAASEETRPLISLIKGLLRPEQGVSSAKEALSLVPRSAATLAADTPAPKKSLRRLLMLGSLCIAATAAITAGAVLVVPYLRHPSARRSLPPAEMWTVGPESEWVGWTSGRCPKKDDKVELQKDRDTGCETNSDDMIWQRLTDKECLHSRIGKLNCDTLEHEHPVIVVVYFGIQTGLPSASYNSMFDQMRGLFAIQRSANAATVSNAVNIQILVANGGVGQKHAKEVLERMLKAGIPIAAVMGFSDSREGTENAIKAACDNGILALTPTLSANQLALNKCFTTIVPMNDVEARVFAEYSVWKGFSKVAIYTTSGPSDAPSEYDLYTQSMGEQTQKSVRAAKLTADDPHRYDIDVDDTIKDCPDANTLIVFAGRHTEYRSFLRSLDKVCGKNSKLDPSQIVADDSASRVARPTTSAAEPQTSPPHDPAAPGSDERLNELILNIPVVVKSFERRSDCPPDSPDCEAWRHDGIIARDTLLSATALNLLLRSAKALNPKAGEAGLRLADVLDSRALLEQLRADLTRGVPQLQDHPSVSAPPSFAEDWKTLTPPDDQRRFFENDGHLSPLRSPMALVHRTAAGNDTVLCGCAYLTPQREPVCKCYEPPPAQ